MAVEHFYVRAVACRLVYLYITKLEKFRLSEVATEIGLYIYCVTVTELD